MKKTIVLFATFMLCLMAYSSVSIGLASNLQMNANTVTPLPRTNITSTNSIPIQVLGNGTINGLHYLAQIEKDTYKNLSLHQVDSFNSSGNYNTSYSYVWNNTFVYSSYNYSILYLFNYFDTNGTYFSGYAVYNTTDPYYGTYVSTNSRYQSLCSTFTPTIGSYSYCAAPLQTAILNAISSGFTPGVTTYTTQYLYNPLVPSSSNNYAYNVINTWNATKGSATMTYSLWYPQVHYNGVQTDLNISYQSSSIFSDQGSENFNMHFNFTNYYYKVYIWNDVMNYSYVSYINTSIDFAMSGISSSIFRYSYNSTPVVTFAKDTTFNGILYHAGDTVPQSFSWLTPSSSGGYGSSNATINAVGSLRSASALQTFNFGLVPASTSAGTYALWSVYNPGNLIAYNDTNHNGMLDVHFDPTTGQPTNSVDGVEGFGVPEIFNETVNLLSGSFSDNNYYYYTYNGQTTSGSNVGTFPITNQVESFASGNPNIQTSQTPLWVTPTQNGNIVTFEFGMNYHSFPVTWNDNQGSNQVSINMNLGWHYYLYADPSTGHYSISSTLSVGALDTTNATLISQLSTIGVNLTYPYTGLATPTLMTFYTNGALNLSAGNGACVATNNLNATVGGVNLAAVTFTGQKANYTWVGPSGNESIPVKASALGLYSSALSNLDGGMLSSRTLGIITVISQALGLQQTNSQNYNFNQYLIITSYGKWQGDAIVHDPTYSAVSAVSSAIPSSNNQSGGHPAPGFEFLIVLVPISIIAYRRRKVH